MKQERSKGRRSDRLQSGDITQPPNGRAVGPFFPLRILDPALQALQAGLGKRTERCP
jgi:hypothetical protein